MAQGQSILFKGLTLISMRQVFPDQQDTLSISRKKLIAKACLGGLPPILARIWNHRFGSKVFGKTTRVDVRSCRAIQKVAGSDAEFV